MYNKSIDELLKLVNSKLTGLTNDEVNIRINQYGLNQLKEKKKQPAWLLFLMQFKDFMIIILAAAAILSGILGDLTDAIIIFVIIILNAIVGFVQEFRAEKAMDALKKMSITQTQVLRNNSVEIVSSIQLVPGDIVLLEAGNVVPADVRLIETFSLLIDESSLTGESIAIEKNAQIIEAADIALGDQLNLAFKGTLVTNGRAKALVINTGMNTELGKIAGLLQGKESVTPLQKRMTKFGKNLSYIIFLICIVLFVSGVLRGEEPFKILLLAISLAVAAIPEALPALITIALSKGASRLSKKNALIRKLPAVETLGSVSFICSDKTGTLTQNKMKVVQTFEHDSSFKINSNHSLLSIAVALNHDVKIDANSVATGESTELALVNYFLDNASHTDFYEVEKIFPRVAELPFDSDRKCMTTVHNYNGKFLVLTKGASESIAEIVSNKNDAQLIKNNSETWASNGIRVLAFAGALLDELPTPFTFNSVEKDLHFIGLVGLMDPAREEVKQAITECKNAGIKVVMITGDHPETAKAIAKQIGILDTNGLTLTGKQLQNLNENEFLNQVEETYVYARVSPDQKLRIVKALQQKGHFAAMTGDGVNDAPSLRSANIGVAMGINGTDVSKEAAHMILLDDNFATIVNAVKEGRRIFDNIRKFVKYIMTCNSAEIWTIFLAPILGMPIPLLPIHILWINLVTDGLPALALANEKAEADVMQRPPRASTESLFANGVGVHIIWVGLLMAGVTLATQAYTMYYSNSHWQTMVFTVLSLSQLGHVLGVKGERTFLFQQGLFSNKGLLISIFITFLLQMAVIYIPFLNPIFKTQPLTFNELLFCIAMSLIVFHAVEMEKWVKTFFKK